MLTGEHRNLAAGALGVFDSFLPVARWSKAAFVLLGVLLFFQAAAYGAVEAWSEFAAVSVSAVLVVVLLLRYVLDPGSRPPTSWLWIPLIGFALLAVLQAAPLPADWTGRLSPQTLERKEVLLGVGPLSMASLSYYPKETWRTFRLMLIGLAVFAASITLGRERGGVARLLTLMFVVGCAEGAFSLVQIVAQADWAFAASGRESRAVVSSGTFLNYSNFCQFMNLATGAGLGLLVVRADKRRHRGGSGDWSNDFWRTDGWIVAGLAVCCLSVFASMSRNGVISMLAATGFFVVMLSRRRSSSLQAWSLTAVPAVVFAGLCIVGFDQVYDRLATLGDDGVYADRWTLTKDTLRAWRPHAMWGIGLNAHEFVFPAYDTTNSTAVAQTADNDYVQLLEESGWVGAGLVACALVLVGWRVLRLTVANRHARTGAAYGAAFGLIAVAIHSWSDFGQRLPAVFSMSAILCGVLVAAGQSVRSASSGPSPASRSARRLRGAAAAGVALPVWAAACVGGYQASQAGAAWAQAYHLAGALAAKEWEGSVEEYQFLLDAAERASQAEPNDVRYAHYLNLYRWQAMLWAGGGAEPVNQQSPEFIEVTGQLADAFVRARMLCPSYGAPYAIEGQLRYYVLGQQVEGSRQMQLAARLSPQDGTAQFNAGLVHAQDGDASGALLAFERALSLSESFFSEAISQLAIRLHRPDLAEGLCSGSVQRLNKVADLFETTGGGLADRAPALRAEASRLLAERVRTGQATPAELARVADQLRGEGDSQQAIALLRKAVAMEYGNISLRLKLAEHLRDNAQYSAALQEATICLRLSPGNARIKQLVEDLYDLQQSAEKP